LAKDQQGRGVRCEGLGSIRKEKRQNVRGRCPSRQMKSVLQRDRFDTVQESGGVHWALESAQKEPGTRLKWFGSDRKSFGSQRKWFGTGLMEEEM
jgi:hypothetical protein